MREGWVALAACVVFLVLPATGAAVELTEATRCRIIKLKAVVKELKDKAQCYERSFKGNIPVSQACLQRAEEKRERLFGRAEQRGGCATARDGATLGARTDAYLRDVTGSLEGTGKKAAPPSESEAKKSESGSATVESAGEPGKTQGKE